MQVIESGDLRVGYLDYGDRSSDPVVLLHGFPYDVLAYEEVAPRLAAADCRVIVPHLRGFGPTRFRYRTTLRSGQQAALAYDLHTLLDSLLVDRAIIAGFDWGSRAACCFAALQPQRVRGLVSCGGYTIQDIAASRRPQAPLTEYRHWYQYYLHGERGRLGLLQNRREFCLLLWRLWSPGWRFEESLYDRSAESFANPDFVEVVVHSYRHRHGLVGGDIRFEETERLLAAAPHINVPTITVDGEDNGVLPRCGSGNHQRFFTAGCEHRIIPDVGHNVPQEAPKTFADIILSLRSRTL